VNTASAGTIAGGRGAAGPAKRHYFTEPLYAPELSLTFFAQSSQQTVISLPALTLIP
jgi:hypothetical protein